MRETGEIKAVLGIILPNLVPAPRATLQATSQVSVNGSDGSVATGERNVVSSFQSAPSHVSKKNMLGEERVGMAPSISGNLFFSFFALSVSSSPFLRVIFSPHILY